MVENLSEDETVMRKPLFINFFVLSVLACSSLLFTNVHNVFGQDILPCPFTISKSADPADDTEFEFVLGGNAIIPGFTLQDPSDRFFEMTIPSETAGITFNEILPPGWILADIQCEGEPGFTFVTFGVNDLTVSCTAVGGIPEGQCTFINVQGTNVPTYSQWGFVALAALLGIAGLIAYRRKLITQ